MVARIAARVAHRQSNAATRYTERGSRRHPGHEGELNVTQASATCKQKVLDKPVSTMGHREAANGGRHRNHQYSQKPYKTRGVRDHLSYQTFQNVVPGEVCPVPCSQIGNKTIHTQLRLTKARKTRGFGAHLSYRPRGNLVPQEVLGLAGGIGVLLGSWCLAGVLGLTGVSMSCWGLGVLLGSWCGPWGLATTKPPTTFVIDFEAV
jgi:hypothetical protein